VSHDCSRAGLLLYVCSVDKQSIPYGVPPNTHARWFIWSACVTI